MKKIFFIMLLFNISLQTPLFANGIWESKSQPSKESANRKCFTRNWTKSSYGFLIFPTVFDLDDFLIFAQTKTHAEMQDYLTDSLSFSSLGATLYSPSEAYVSEAQAINYSMNPNRIFQAQGLIMRPVSQRECEVNWEYILVMTPANLNSTTYGYLQNGQYHSSSMNKFATDPVTEGSPIATFTGETPTGHAETSPHPCPEEMENPRRPFWGWGPQSSETCVQTSTWFNPVTQTNEPVYTRCLGYYVFWIKVSSDCYQAYDCSGNHFVQS